MLLEQLHAPFVRLECRTSEIVRGDAVRIVVRTLIGTQIVLKVVFEDQHSGVRQLTCSSRVVECGEDL